MLKLLQTELPKLWTDELYSPEFRARVSSYKDFDHALKHITKAVGKLIDVTEAADHDGKVVFDKDVDKYLADLVICTVRLALTNPNGQINLEQAVLDRIEKKMGVKLEVGVFCLDHRKIMTNGICPKCEEQPDPLKMAEILKKIPVSEIASWSGMTFDEASAFMKKVR